MISTYYSNSFEVLSTILYTKIGFQIEDFKKHNISVFQQIPVMVPTPAVAERLNRLMAEHFGITPGIRFTNVATWMFSVLGRSLSNEVISDEIDWLLFSILSEKKQTPEEDVPKGQERLYAYLRKLDQVGILEFARHLNNVYVTYGSYRFDWLQEWAGEKYSFPGGKLPAPRYRFELSQLTQNPDFLWQKELWNELITKSESVCPKGLTGAILGWLEDTIRRFKSFDASTLTLPMHLFLPFSLPPSLLPLIKEFEHASGLGELSIYLLNPSSEYWFESTPKAKFDWKDDSVEKPESEAAIAYLRANEAGTRATIDRLDSFLYSTEEEAAREAENPEAFYQSRKNAGVVETHTREFVSKPHDLRPKAHAEVEAAYLEYPNNSFLHRFQNSILKLDNSLLPDEPNVKDVSLRVLKAPSFQREVEAAIDILHNWFVDPERNLGPSDVLIVVPDIDKAAPVIDGVMTSLPHQEDLDLRIPWKIIGRSESNQNLLADTFTGLGRLLLSNFAASDFFSWLEKSPVQQQWGFSLDDLSLLRTWLTTAGFVEGLNVDQLNEVGYSSEDISLQNAVERLTLGFFLDTDCPLDLREVIPIRGDEAAGFDCVYDEGGRLLLALSELYKALLETRQELEARSFKLPADQWEAYLGTLKNRFFGNLKEPNESLRFDSVVSRLCDALTRTVGEAGEDVSFAVVLNELQSCLSKIKDPSMPAGGLTFAPIGLVRGLPFKVICCLGFDEHCGFPGTPKFEEFDLMKTVHRRGDRDARLDNNGVFLDTLLSARENLILSYTIGTKPQSENNPSIVIENFKTYFLSHARDSGKHGWEKSLKLWDSIVSHVPLNRFSPYNFQMYGLRNLFWMSPRTDVLSAINEAAQSDASLQGIGPKFADTSIPDEKLPPTLQDPDRRALPLNFLINFLTSYNEWGAQLLKLSMDEREAPEAPINPSDDDRLLNSTLLRETLSLLKQGISKKAILELGKLNPKYGMPSARESYLEGAVEQLEADYQKFKKEAAELQGPLTQKLDFKLGPEFEGLEFVQSITDELSDFYLDNKTEDLKNRWVRFEFCPSDNAVVKAALRQLFWILGGKPYRLRIFNAKVDPKPDPYNDDFIIEILEYQIPEVLPLLVRLFESHRKYSLGFCSEEDDVMWQGVPKAQLKRVQKLSSDFKKALKAFLMEPFKAKPELGDTYNKYKAGIERSATKVLDEIYSIQSKEITSK